MIKNYHRPGSLREALLLLEQPNTRPLGGGTILSHGMEEDCSVIDLQDIGLSTLRKSEKGFEIGATVTLQTLLESSHSHVAMKNALQLETPLNIRNLGTVAGTLFSCDGRSPFGVTMLALDAKCVLDNDDSKIISLGDLFIFRNEALPGKLISKIIIPQDVKLAFERVSRTPADKPVICAALAQWPAGRTRLALGGWGKSPTLAMDGNDVSGVEIAAENAAMEAGDEWAGAEYRKKVAVILAMRCRKDLETKKQDSI